eukprot:6750112-Pyramimonas_sp.AAC.1
MQRAHRRSGKHLEHDLLRTGPQPSMVAAGRGRWAALSAAEVVSETPAHAADQLQRKTASAL